MSYEYNIRKKNNLLCLFLILSLLLLSLSLFYVGFSLTISDFYWSLFFVLTNAVILWVRFYINKENIVSLYSLFFLTSLLFIGGRFFSVFLGYNSAPLFELDFFVYSVLSEQ